MFFVRQQGKITQVFRYFVDAWLFIYLECECFAVILDQNGDTWTVNPAWNRGSTPII